MESRRATDPATFVARHQHGLLRWLGALGCDRQRAEEHCQDALLAALHRGVDARDERAARAWLRTTARNLFWMELRRRRRRPAEHTLDELEQAWQAIDGDRDGGEAALEALRHCLEQAEARDRALLEQRYRDNASRAAMARAHGIGEAGIKQALRRARARVQRCTELRLCGSEETWR